MTTSIVTRPIEAPAAPLGFRSQGRAGTDLARLLAARPARGAATVTGAALALAVFWFAGQGLIAVGEQLIVVLGIALDAVTAWLAGASLPR